MLNVDDASNPCKGSNCALYSVVDLIKPVGNACSTAASCAGKVNQSDHKPKADVPAACICRYHSNADVASRTSTDGF
jgi:hypothetical protein